MGVLVNGAVKVEEEVERLKRNLSSITSDTRTKAGAGIKSTWRDISDSFPAAKLNLKPAMRGDEPYRDRLSQGTKAFLDNAEIRAKVIVRRTIDRTIVELEKIRHKLDENSKHRRWHAA